MFLKMSWGNSTVHYNFLAKSSQSCAILISEMEKDEKIKLPKEDCREAISFYTNVTINLNHVTDYNASR